MKWFDPAGYERYRDCGLLGLTLEGDEDPSWRGRNGQRNAAFTDCLYNSGLRLEEGGSLLLVELPPDDPRRGFYTCHMAEQVAKGKVGVQVLDVPQGLGAGAELLRGRAGGRSAAGPGRRPLRAHGRGPAADADAAESAGEAGRAGRHGGGTVAGCAGRQGTAASAARDAAGLGAGGALAERGWDAAGPARLAARVHPGNKRLRDDLGLEGFAGAAHMLRHSFALRWFSVGRLLFDKKFAHLDGEELRDLRYEFGSTWDLVRLLLGHADQRTTQETYLEPFEALELELLLMHADNSGISDLMATVYGADRRVLGDPVAAR